MILIWNHLENSDFDFKFYRTLSANDDDDDGDDDNLSLSKNCPLLYRGGGVLSRNLRERCSTPDLPPNSDVEPPLSTSPPVVSSVYKTANGLTAFIVAEISREPASSTRGTCKTLTWAIQGGAESDVGGEACERKERAAELSKLSNERLINRAHSDGRTSRTRKRSAAKITRRSGSYGVDRFALKTFVQIRAFPPGLSRSGNLKFEVKTIWRYRNETIIIIITSIIIKFKDFRSPHESCVKRNTISLKAAQPQQHRNKSGWILDYPQR